MLDHRRQHKLCCIFAIQRHFRQPSSKVACSTDSPGGVRIPCESHDAPWQWPNVLLQSQQTLQRSTHITNVLITCATQAQEAPEKQADFLAAWESGQGKDISQCWDNVIRTAKSFLSRSQQKVSVMSRQCCALSAGFHYANVSMQLAPTTHAAHVKWLTTQVLPVILNMRHYSARLEFFRSLAEGAQPPEVLSPSCTFF